MPALKIITIIFFAALLLACGCGGSNITPAACDESVRASPSLPILETVYINFEHGRFVPDMVAIPAGSTVVWQVSEDYNHHWVVCDDVPFRGWFYEWYPYKFIFNEPGTYGYYDGANPAVTGSVTVY